MKAQQRSTLLLPIFFNTILALSALYAPQPLLPVLSQTFSVSRETAATLTTITFIPLALAPLAYGYLLETTSPIKILKIAVFLLAVSEFCFAATPFFSLLMVIRLAQGLLIPAVLTSLMTYLSGQSSTGNIQRVMAMYIATTILGGFVGRAASGLIANLYGWRFSFLALAITLIIGFLSLFKLRETEQLKIIKPQPIALLEVLHKPAFFSIYLSIFCLFLVFAAMMNFLPFRLTELSNQANELKIGLMYSGYMMGIVTSLGAPKFIVWISGELSTLKFGFFALALSLIGLATHHVWLLFIMMFFFCGAMFLVHSTASGLINQLAGNKHRGLTNGLYVAFYYAGGSIGSFAPGIIYRYYGWNGFLIVLALVCIIGYICINKVKLLTENRGQKC